MNLDLKRKMFNIVIGKNYVKNYDEKIEKLSSLGCNYATILHDCDVNDDGVLKNPHYHLVVQLNERTRAKTFLNRLCDILGCDSINIQIDECFNYIKCIQYLVHKNDKSKFQYDINLIKSNLGELIYTYINCEDYSIELTTEQLIDIVINTPSVIDIIKIIGLSKYNTYRNTICDIRNDIRNLKQE